MMLNEASAAPGPRLKGLQVVYGSRTRRGLSHPNEDRHAVASWTDWLVDAHLVSPSLSASGSDGPAGAAAPGVVPPPSNVDIAVPRAHVVAPLCTGSARKDTSLFGTGTTGQVDEKSFDRILPGGDDDSDQSQHESSHQRQSATTSNATDGRGSLATNACSDRPPDRQNAYLWTVCDGHDGPEAAEFTCKRVGETLARIWHSPNGRNIPANVLQNVKLGEDDDWQAYARGYAMSNALARTFERVDASFKLSVEEDGQRENCTAGSCVTSLFLVGNLMCCAGLGDCKAAILTLENADLPVSDPSLPPDDGGGTPKSTQQFQVTWFSKEHRSSSPKERARIRARGGWFRHGRVGGVLEPTRTIGDFDVKASQPPGVVIATPEVRTFTVTKPAFVLIASDGVWDVMDASQLLRTLKKRKRLWREILSWLGANIPARRSLMRFGFRRRAKSKEGLSMLQLPTGGDLCAMADTLVTRAHDLGSDDDCTCVVAYLRPVIEESSSVEAWGSAEGADMSSRASGAGEEEYEEDVAGSRLLGDDIDDDDDDEELEDDEEEEEDLAAGAEDELAGAVAAEVRGVAFAGIASAGSASSGSEVFGEYEKWRKPAVIDGVDEVDDAEELPPGGTGGSGVGSLRTSAGAYEDPDATTRGVMGGPQLLETGLFPTSLIDVQDAPEVIEKARKRREERRLIRERRRKFSVLLQQNASASGTLSLGGTSVPTASAIGGDALGSAPAVDL